MFGRGRDKSEEKKLKKEAEKDYEKQEKKERKENEKREKHEAEEQKKREEDEIERAGKLYGVEYMGRTQVISKQAGYCTLLLGR